MSLRFTDRVTRVEPSATVAVSNLASQLEADGVDVVDLSVGEPDFPTPEPVVDAGKAAIDAGHTGYAPSKGVPELREAVADSLGERGLSYTSDQIIVTPGGKQGLFETFQTLVEEGDEVVLLDPAWVSYEAMTKLAGGTLKRVDLTPHEFQLEPALDELSEAVTDDTALVVVNSPNNPTGAVYSEAALEGVRDLAVDHDATVLSDEIYDRITYDADAISLGSLDGMDGRTVTLNGFSKAYSMTGWRLGYVAGPDEFVTEASKIQSHSVTCATNFVQYAGVTALEECDEFVAGMRDAFEERRELVVDLFADEGVDVPIGDGAFYAMVPVAGEARSASKNASSAERSSADSRAAEPRDDGERSDPRADDDQQWCEDAIERAHVAMVPGGAFGAGGYARLSYAASEERLREGVERLADADLL